MITEREFDALIVRQVANDLISVASIGSAANKHINTRWFSKFISAPSILLRMDADDAGWDAHFQLKSLSFAAYKIRVPKAKMLMNFTLSQDKTPYWIG